MLRSSWDEFVKLMLGGFESLYKPSIYAKSAALVFCKRNVNKQSLVSFHYIDPSIYLRHF